MNLLVNRIEGIIRTGQKTELNRPWEEVLHLAKRYSHPKRSRISFTGGMARDFYYISEGKVCLQASSASGKERTTNYFGPGCLFNLATVFVNSLLEADNGVWLVLQDTVFWRFPGSLLHDPAFVRQYPHLIINLMSGMCFSIITQYSWLTDMYLADPMPRLCRYILGLSVSSGSDDFAPGVTQQEAATHLGMHRGTLSAALKELREAGVVAEFTRNRLHILDMDRLKKLTML